MDNAIDYEERQKVLKAAGMERVPLTALDRLIKERRAHALEKNAEGVEQLNKMIRQLLAV